ncbi:hypothetical protein T484DRAFT_1796206, partial [Baffinella frigidus]
MACGVALSPNVGFGGARALGVPVAIAAGGKHSLILTDRGEVIGFGSNYYGQLAARSSIAERTWKPFLLRPTAFGLGVPNGIATGADHSIIRTQDGGAQGVQSLWLFGSNRYGQLAREEHAGAWEFNAEPAKLDSCSVLNASVCDDYTVLEFSAGAGFTHAQHHSGARDTWDRSFSPAGATACTLCPRLTYSESPGAGACDPCPNGTTMDAGAAGSSSSSDCRGICGLGTFGTVVVNNVAVSNCQPCPDGYASNVFGATSCGRCPAGTYASAGATSCTACPGDTSSDPNVAAAGVGDCFPLCAPGAYSSNGLQPCTECLQGTRSTLNGSQTCSPCGAGASTVSAGATFCLQ